MNAEAKVFVILGIVFFVNVILVFTVPKTRQNRQRRRASQYLLGALPALALGVHLAPIVLRAPTPNLNLAFYSLVCGIGVAISFAVPGVAQSVFQTYRIITKR